ncbi:methyltransferase [Streptomyces syringium]|uniref:methyltransferase n=1 Tax=Streptomyces syringium TaxID=76729 RepID=UPI00345341AB
MPLPAPDTVRAAARADIGKLTAHWHSYRYDAFQPRSLELIAQFTARAMRQLVPTLEDLHAAGADTKYTPLLNALLSDAASHGVISEQGEGHWQLASDPCPDALFQEMVRDFPAQSACLQAYATCGRHLADVLVGRQNPLELLFSETDAIAARFYDNTPSLTYHNRIAQHLLRNVLADWPGSRPLRILEVGAGTGATTELLLPELPPGNTHYTYTDISTGFFAAARERLSAYDFVHYRRLDLDEDPGAQGFAAASFDVVIASNALHTTRDLTLTVRRIASLLVDGGHLLAVELTNFAPIVAVFGLLDSFWAATDSQLRPTGPLLPREKWTNLLEQCDFRDILHTGDSEEPARTDYTVIHAARSPRPQASTPQPQPSTPDENRVPRYRLIADLAPDAAPEGSPLCRALEARLSASAHDGLHHVVLSADPATWTTHLTDATGSVDIVLLADPDQPSTRPPAETTERIVHACAVLRAVARACTQEPATHDITVWLIAPNNRTLPSSTPGQGAASAIWGAARSLSSEEPGIHLRRVALACLESAFDNDDSPLLDALLSELVTQSPEDEVTLTSQGRYVPRLRPAPPQNITITDKAAAPSP